jgi:hypothetical protein
VGKLWVEPFQAHDENIFNESGGTLKNVAILWQNLVFVIRTLTNIHNLWTVQLVPVCIILSPHSFCTVIWSIAVNLYLQYINIKVCKITKKTIGEEGYSKLYHTFPPLLILTICFFIFLQQNVCIVVTVATWAFFFLQSFKMWTF